MTTESACLAVGLLHWPILDRNRVEVATNITNFDIHDIARVSTVYGLDHYVMIHKAAEQLMFVERLLDHWRIGEGLKFNPLRSQALAKVRTAESISAAVSGWQERSGRPVKTIGTTARKIEGVDRIGFRNLREKLMSGSGGGFDGGENYLLLFGTGYGMTDETLKNCDLLLEPLKGAPPLDYRHLSVRSAVSICLDRLLGEM